MEVPLCHREPACEAEVATSCFVDDATVHQWLCRVPEQQAAVPSKRIVLRKRPRDAADVGAKLRTIAQVQRSNLPANAVTVFVPTTFGAAVACPCGNLTLSNQRKPRKDSTTGSITLIDDQGSHPTPLVLEVDSAGVHRWHRAPVFAASACGMDDGVPPSGTTSEAPPAFAFGSAEYFASAAKRQLVDLLKRGESLKAGDQVACSTNVNTMRQRFPALRAIRRDVLESRVLGVVAQNCGRFIDRNGDGSISLSTTLFGAPVVVGHFYSVEESLQLAHCESRVLDHADVYQGTLRWSVVPSAISLQKLLPFPIGSVSSVITDSMNESVLLEVLRVAEFVSVLRPQTLGCARRWEHTLQAAVPVVFREHRDDAPFLDVFCSYLAVSAGIAKAAARDVRVSRQHATAQLKALFSGDGRTGLPDVLPVTVIARAGHKLSETHPTTSGEADEQDLLRDLFDEGVQPADKAAVTEAAALPSIVMRHNQRTGEVEMIRDPSLVREMWEHEAFDEATTEAEQATPPHVCPYCLAESHAALRNCPWFVAHAIQLRAALRLPPILRSEWGDDSDSGGTAPVAAHINIEDQLILDNPQPLKRSQPMKQAAPDDDVAVGNAIVSVARHGVQRRAGKRRGSIWRDIVKECWNLDPKKADAAVSAVGDIEVDATWSLDDAVAQVRTAVSIYLVSDDARSTFAADLDAAVAGGKHSKELRELFS